MSDRDALLKAIAANPYEDTPRLALADWLDEHGEHARAEFIRVQIELEPIRDQYEIERAAELHAREEQLLNADMKDWFGAMPKGWNDLRTGASLEFRRGFPDTLALPARTFLELGAQLRAAQPTIRRVALFRLDEYGERIAGCTALAGLAELELACWYSETDARALAASPHLRELQVLEYWLGNWGASDTVLCRTLGAGKAWPNLRELTLMNCENRYASSRKKLVAVANRAAGRAVAVYRPGYPELFPFAADFGYVFPGRLPNGRAAIGALDTTTEPPCISVTTFGKHGNPIRKVIRVPLPDALLQLPKQEWDRESALKQQLVDVLGFVPGFIRVRPADIPGDQWAKPYWHWDVWESMCGRPDIDNDGDWGEWETGNGGKVRHHMRNQEWLFGHSRWADKTGRVHST